MSKGFSNYKHLDIGHIKPTGWLKRQLELQATGLTGNVEDIWEDLGSNSAWLGGDGEAWERGPYFLDGLIPLAYILDDEKLKKKASIWIESILEHQKENGNFGPTRTQDWWPRVVACKALISYHRVTKDEKILKFLTKFLKYFNREIDIFPPRYWAFARSLELILIIDYVYGIEPQEYLLELAKKAKQYSYDWDEYFLAFPYKYPSSHYLNKNIINLGRKIGGKLDAKLKVGTKPLRKAKAKQILKFNQRKLVKTIMLTHGVNIAMAIKYPVIFGSLFNDINTIKIAKNGLNEIMKYHGTAAGIFTGDEHLNGAEPTKGIELCSVVEMMYSLGVLLKYTGDLDYADNLELLAFNTLPATFTPDMFAHQYVQQPNQISATLAKRDFFDVDPDGNIFGLKPNYGCCLANMHQGFPKFVDNLFMSNAKEMCFFTYAPCIISTSINGKAVEIEEKTNYPFDNKIDFNIKKWEINDNTSISFRIPKYTKVFLYINNELIVKTEDDFIACPLNTNEETGTKNYNNLTEPNKKTIGNREFNYIIYDKKIIISGKFKKGDLIWLNLDNPLVAINNPDSSISIRKGSLLLSLALNQSIDYLRGNKPFADYEVRTKDKWNIAPKLDKKKMFIHEEKHYPINKDMPFDSATPPYEAYVHGYEILNWKEVKNSAGNTNFSIELAPEETILKLVPYGSTLLRISQFPQIRKY